MTGLMISPFSVLLISFIVLWISARIGAFFRRKRRDLDDETNIDLGLILAATLTLLGLIIGFSFAMAINRYDQRKNYEEAEANAIGTEFFRADLLPATDGRKVRALLAKYTDERILFYTTQDQQELHRVNAATARLETDLWSAVQAPAVAQPTPVATLVASGMNDVLNSQGYTQAAWWNRIPVAAWGLMIAIAICCNMLLGYNLRRGNTEPVVLVVLPLVVSISFLLIADLDSPRGGIIHVRPQNLISLSQSMQPQ